MNLDKVVKYSVPLFVLAIVSRSIEEISFIYYAVSPLCVSFIVLMFISSKSNNTKKLSELNEPDSRRTSFEGMTTKGESSFRRSPESELVKRSDSLFATLKRMTPMLLFLIPGIWFLLTSLWSSYPDISAARAFYFILISLGCISAGILWIKYSDNNIFNFLLPANVIVVLISLFSFISNIPSDSWTGGHGKGFMGFFGHQNLLASVILFTLPSVVFKLPQQLKCDQLTLIRNTRQKLFSNNSLLTTYYLPLTAYSLLLIANILLLTLTYSRSAIVALIFGVLVLLILNRNWNVLAYGLATALVLGAFIYLIPSFNQAVDKILKKDFPEVYSSRIWMWEPSYRAAQNGGLTGLGYGMSDPNIKPGSLGDHYEGERFVREKGNSSLALVEETGLIGLILFLIPLIYAASKFIIYNLEFRMRPFDTSTGSVQAQLRVTDKSLLTTNLPTGQAGYSLLTAALAAMLLHAQFEAWWVGVGSVQLPLFFIYLGLAVYQLSVTEI